MSEHLRKEEAEINAANAVHDIEERRKLRYSIIKLEVFMKDVLQRLHNLEVKENARAKEEHARNEHLDFVNSEGLGET